MAGANEVFGDGHVAWKSGAAFDPTNMEALSNTVPWVMGNRGADGRDVLLKPGYIAAAA